MNHFKYLYFQNPQNPSDTSNFLSSFLLNGSSIIYFSGYEQSNFDIKRFWGMLTKLNYSAIFISPND